ncbi:hypothetical protein ABZ829_27980 [Streptomyces xanthochromogenes]|uniref:hypothetical protein n=1 Tax=Streptomyces xanthochromogenes TaxID=67384 RepID=UPI00343626B0
MPFVKTDIISGGVCIVALTAEEAQEALHSYLGDNDVDNLFAGSDDALNYLANHPQPGARVYSATLDIRPFQS